MRPQDLPIYRVTYELMLKVTQLVRHFRRDLKQSLGGRITDACVDVVVNVYRANSARTPDQRRKHIHRILEGVQVLELSLRLAHDLQMISHKQHGEVVELTDEVGRQAHGWLKSTRS